MNTQMDRTKVENTGYGEDIHDHNVGLQHSGEGHDESGQHSEKKSVLKKVKAKAKKIKDTITGHGHNHSQDHDEGDDHDDEMDTDPDVHGTHTAQGISTGGAAGQHGIGMGGKTAIGSDEQKRDPAAHGITPGMGGAAGQLGTGIGERTVIGDSVQKIGGAGGQYGTGMGGRTGVGGDVPKSDIASHGITTGLGGTVGQHGTGIGERTDIGGDAQKINPVAHGITAGIGGAAGQHGTSVGERTTIVGDERESKPSGYQVFDPTTTHYVPGQEETLDWSRTDTDTGRQLESEDQPHVVHGKFAVMHSSGQYSTGDLEILRKPKYGGSLEKDPQSPTNVGGDVHPTSYEAKVTDPQSGGYGSAAAESLLPGHGSTTRQSGGIPAVSAATEEASFVPVSKPTDYQTFDTTASKYIPGQEETLGWSRTDTGRSKLSEEQPFAPKNSPLVAHSSGHHGIGFHEIGEKDESGMLGEILKKPSALEKDPHGPRDVGEKRHAENYQSKVSDPTGRGSEEIDATPVVDQMGKMNIHDESSQTRDSNVYTGQQEDLFKPDLDSHQKMSTGSHDQFSPETVTRETTAFVQNPDSEPQRHTIGLTHEVHDEPEPNQGTYTQKISSAASALAEKAKQATGTVTSKLGMGYGGSTAASPGYLDTRDIPDSLDNQPVKGPVDEEPVPGGYGETLSSVSTAVADTAAHAKDALASKLGYGKGHEAQPEQAQSELVDQSSNTGGVGGYGKKLASTVKETIAPVYDTVAGLGSTVASKIHGSGTENPGHTVAPDKGVSVKEYLAEKLTPGEDDKALSQVITESLPLHKQKEDMDIAGQGDAGKKVEVEKRVTESEDGRKIEIKGRVTESEEVANRLGRSEDVSYDGAGPGLASPGKSVMDRIYDATGSWFKGGEPVDHAE